MMKRYKQFESLKVSDFEVDEWKHPMHNHNHFEFIFIADGCGYHTLNDIKYKYKKGDLFLLGPEDAHQFEVKKRTHFTYFKFTKLYITHHPDLSTPNHWNQQVDQLLYNPERKKGNLLCAPTDRLLVQELMQIIATEYHKKKVLNQQIIFQLFSVILLIIKRNRKAYHVPVTMQENSGIAEEILSYIDLNIYDPKKLTLKNLAEQFHYSPHYIGMLFKEKIGSTLRDYVSHYRYKLVEQRLKHSQIGVKQVASEFGFVDESHLHKFVKSKAGKSLSDIRA